MSLSPASIPAGMLSLNKEDQRIKLRKRQQIETHWACSIEEVVPQAIRPRLTHGRAKAKIGSSAPPTEWWRLSVELLNKLSDLAALTSRRLPFAQALLEAQVKRRHGDYTTHNRDVAEVLRSDLVNLVEGLRERENEEEEEEEGSSDEAGGAGEDEIGAIKQKVGQDVVQHLGNDEDRMDKANSARNANQIDGLGTMHDRDCSGATQSLVDEQTNNKHRIKREATPADTPPSKRRQTTPFTTQSLASAGSHEMKTSIASIRASAARLHQQAAQKEAKAWRLEAEMFAREAGER